MPLSPVQITAANEVISILCTTPAGPRTKRKLGEMFMELVDKDDFPEYYEVRTIKAGFGDASNEMGYSFLGYSGPKVSERRSRRSQSQSIQGRTSRLRRSEPHLLERPPLQQRRKPNSKRR